MYYLDVRKDVEVFRVGRAFYGWLGERRRSALEPALEFVLRRVCRKLLSQGQPQRSGDVLVPADAWTHLSSALGEE